MNDLEIASICDPALTTVRIHRGEMGRMAVRRLSDLIQHIDEEPKRIDVLCELIVRASCGKAPETS
jgi:LacI family transcriptional regulator|tara:strand:- start:40 stop:237 length:198 start_codon:yes stop_codon:yes gene_type:complete